MVVFSRSIPPELQECETYLLHHQPEVAIQCLNAQRPAKLLPNSHFSVAWLELWLEAKLKDPSQVDAIGTNQSEDAINLAIQWLGSEKLDAQSKKRLSNSVYQHLNAEPSVASDSITSVLKEPSKNHLLLAFMVLLSFCILSALLIINRYYLNGNKYFNTLGQDQRVLQHHVKERNQALIQQYSRLQDYSIANSHLVRAPLARLLGLVELMKDEPLTSDGKFYLQHMAQSCEELDEWVKKMNTILDPETSSSEADEELVSLNHFLSIEK